MPLKDRVVKGEPMKERDYDYLVGKEVDYQGMTGIVIGCDYWIGITIVNKKNKEDYLACLQGPMVFIEPDDKEEHKKWYEKRYSALFFSFVRQIKKGKMELDIVSKIINRRRRRSSGPTAEFCPFNQ